jgi:hypothetical protein
MPAALFPPASPDAAFDRSRSKSWLFAIGGLIAGGCAVLAISAIAAAPAGLLVGIAWQQVAPPHQALLAFDSRMPVAKAQVLRGVSGEAIQASTRHVDIAALSPAAILEGGELTPTALDRLSSGDCISLTIASGQKLSFRIVGAQTSEAQRNLAGSSNIDLAVTPCSPSSEIILKAVIEKALPKESAVQRSL